MNTQRAGEVVRSRKITFPNGNSAQVVTIPIGFQVIDALQRLGLEQPNALILIAGAAASLDNVVQLRLISLFSRGIAQAAVDRHAFIIDGGTQAGVMALMGQGVADRNRRTPLIGVAPAGKVAYPNGSAEEADEEKVALDPNHSHFVLVDSDEWGSETETMYQLAAALANGTIATSSADTDSESSTNRRGSSSKIPVVTVLAGGQLDGIAKDEVLHSVRHGWPVIVIDGSGPLPDKISRLHRDKRRLEERMATRYWSALYRLTRRWPKRRLAIDDPALAEIVEDGDLRIFPLDGEVAELKNLIIQQLPILREEENVLSLAWERFAVYDANAARHQRNYRLLRNWPLVLGVLTTILALTYAALTTPGWLSENAWPGLVMRFFIIALPIVTSILLAADMRFKAGSRHYP